MNILIVDDSIICRDSLKKNLSELTEISNFSEANNGQEALELIQSGSISIDLIFLDIHMPEMTGYELYEQLKLEHITTPVVMVSTETQTHEITKFLLIGAANYLIKPYTKIELKNVLDDLDLDLDLVDITQEV